MATKGVGHGRRMSPARLRAIKFRAFGDLLQYHADNVANAGYDVLADRLHEASVEAQRISDRLMESDAIARHLQTSVSMTDRLTALADT